MTGSPYQFLDSYSVDDADRFFGRDIEIDVLLADVVVSPLVVLFAKTGTGKTSLIDAGVRPQLHRRGYATAIVRTRDDPDASVRALAGFPDVDDLADGLREYARAQGKPVVFFFDQFEEFFLYVVQQNGARAAAFVDTVGDIYDDRGSGIHLVFSMREEWFVDMAIFRERIPAIFHKDANLRLRWFDREQARSAIVGPVPDGTYAPALVERLLAELVDTGQEVAGKPSPGDIEPAQLQIVCDTLWRRPHDGELSVADYEAMATPGRPASIARQILDQRLIDVFAGVGGRDELELLPHLLPELATPEHTKRVREYNDLVSSLLIKPGVTVEAATVRRAIEGLRDARLLDIVPRGTSELIELTHDYLALRLDELIPAVSLIWPSRQLADGEQAWREHRTLLTSSVLPDVLDAADRLALDAGGAELILRSALGHLAEVAPLLPALERGGGEVWAILADRVANGADAERAHALTTLVAAGSPAAFDVLRRAMHDSERAPAILDALSHADSPLAVAVLEQAAGTPALADPARAALAELASSPGRGAVAAAATDALRRSLAPLSPDAALAALLDVAAPVSVTLLEEIGTGDALEKIAALAAGNARLSARIAARRALFDAVDRMLAASAIERWAVEALGAIDTSASVALLRRIADADPELEAPVRDALDALKQSPDADVSSAAAKTLDRLAGTAQPPEVPWRPVSPGGSRGGTHDEHFSAVVQLLANGRLIPFLGAGASQVDRREGGGPPMMRELAAHLQRQFGLPEQAGHEEPLDKLAEYVAAVAGRGTLEDTLASLFSHGEPNRLHRLLASLPGRFRQQGRPSIPAILSVSYDDALERAFYEAGEPFELLTYGEDGFAELMEGKPGVLERLATSDRTAIVRLHGGVAATRPGGASFVITEDDHVRYAVRAASPDFLPATIARAITSSGFLFLGYSLRDYSVRVMLEALSPGRVTRRYPSWAVLLRVDPLEAAVWRERGTDIVERSLDEYTAELAARLDDLDLSALPA